jgi:hypothetical protein
VSLRPRNVSKSRRLSSRREGTRMLASRSSARRRLRGLRIRKLSSRESARLRLSANKSSRNSRLDALERPPKLREGE